MWGKVTITLNIKVSGAVSSEHYISRQHRLPLDWTGTGSCHRFALLRTGLDVPIHNTIAIIAIAIARPPLPIDSLSFFDISFSIYLVSGRRSRYSN